MMSGIGWGDSDDFGDWAPPPLTGSAPVSPSAASAAPAAAPEAPAAKPFPAPAAPARVMPETSLPPLRAAAARESAATTGAICDVGGVYDRASLNIMNTAALKALVQSEPFGNQTIPARGSNKADLIETAMGCLGPIGLPCPERIKALAGM